MKLVFATEDKVTINRMTGRSPLFAFYTIENGEVKDIEYVENNHSHDHSHDHDDENGHGHSHKAIINEIVKRDALFITRHLGKHFKEGVIELGVNFKMTQEENIEKAIKLFS
ncbi:MAG: hypothetical protein KAG96_07690 [Ichthyobacteriaceae bacterium]|nr:hypothetical protein [Ichthyobacteriaceae bacterium]